MGSVAILNFLFSETCGHVTLGAASKFQGKLVIFQQGWCISTSYVTGEAAEYRQRNRRSVACGPSPQHATKPAIR
jgi:hypothetical protein